MKSLGPEAYAIVYNGRHVGNVMIRTMDAVSHVAEVGILLGDRSLHGKGVASAALAQFSADVFARLRLAKLWAGTCNPAASRLFVRAGWTCEGIQRRHVFLTGRWCDRALFGCVQRKDFLPC